MKSRLVVFAAMIFAVSAITATSIAQRNSDNEKPITGDFKITIRNTISGQTYNTTTMIKGKRERSENSSMGAE
jgi:hypothetical protein